MSRPGFVILGSGPVALACALWCEHRGPVRVLCAATSSEDAALPRIEVVPMATVAGLVELGVHPHAIGVFEFNERRLVAWDRAEPITHQTPAAAHLERPALDRVLLAIASTRRHIELCRRDVHSAYAEAVELARAGTCVIDATGRRAALATRTHHYCKPWIARTFHVPYRNTMSSAHAVVPFMVAALEHGYAYRAVGHRCCTVGIVGRGEAISGSPALVRERLYASDARWLVEDISAVQWTSTEAKPAGIQWAEGEAAAFIGDAALARDALSSQGLATGLVDARYAAEIHSRADYEMLAQRSRMARVAHARELVDMIAACRWRAHDIWSDYADFLMTSALRP